MANLFWTIVPFVLTFAVAAWFPQKDQPQAVPARANRKSSPCRG